MLSFSPLLSALDFVGVAVYFAVCSIGCFGGALSGLPERELESKEAMFKELPC